MLDDESEEKLCSEDEMCLIGRKKRDSAGHEATIQLVAKSLKHRS
jgi:hypothetical protein